MAKANKSAYPHKFNVSMSISDFINKYSYLNAGEHVESDCVSLAGTRQWNVFVFFSGRVHSKRESGAKLIFYDLHSDEHRVQVMANLMHYKSPEEFYSTNGNIKMGDIVGCTGMPGKKKLLSTFQENLNMVN